MKISKILAGMSAAALAASMMSMVSFAAETAAFENKVTMNDSSWWTEKEITKADLIGDVDPDAITKIDFACDGDIIVGYNSVTPKADGEGFEWVQQADKAKTQTIDGSVINLADDGYYLKVCLSTGDSEDYDVTWTVYTDEGSETGVKDVELTPDNCNFNAEANTFYLFGDAAKGEAGYFATADDLAAANITAVTFILNIDDAAVESGDWIGGGIGFNSETTGWQGHEWTPQAFVTDEEGNYVDKDSDGLADRVKECCVQKIADGKYAYTIVTDASIFSATDKYAQVWMQDWSIGTVTLDKIILNPTEIYANPEQPKVEATDESKVDSTESTDSADSTETTDSTDSKATDSKATTSSKAANNAANKNPSTGAAALAAVGVALAGAAVVATKKRK